MSAFKPQLALGTVQFGLNYGISNRHGMPPQSEIIEVLANASQNGVDLIDTSSEYGESEQRLGELLPSDHIFSIVTKTPTFGSSEVGQAEEEKLRSSFVRSLERLRQKRVYGLLLHHAGDALAPGGERLIAAMNEFRARGLVQKIGVSIYSESALSEILSRYAIDIVQLPLNLLDQRLLQGDVLGQLSRNGIEIHARSAFLQGLLLMKPDEIPSHLSMLRPMIQEFRCFCEQKALSSLVMALAFMRRMPVDRVVVGVNSSREFAEIIAAWNVKVDCDIDYSRFSIAEIDLVDPSRWPSRQQRKI